MQILGLSTLVMNPHQTIIWAFALDFTFVAGWLDWRSRRIPNWLTVPGFFAGIALNTSLGGWRGGLAGLEGAGLALVLLFPLVLMRGLGAGDWKLMGAVGAILAPYLFLRVLLATIFLSGLMAIVLMIRRKRVKSTLRNLAVLVHGFFSFGLRASPEISLDNPSLLKLPFGVAAAFGTLICFVQARWGM
jgi:prepilin peptidase CpaA